jgi:glutamine amidotransferase
MGNLFSVKNACELVGMSALISYSEKELLAADAVILPGVGAFGDAMSALEGFGLVSVLRDIIEMGKPFLGICLGMQLLMSESEEFGNFKGLGIFDGYVKRFSNISDSNKKIRVPHVGWNRVYFNSSLNSKDLIFSKLSDGEFMYFVHSYFVKPTVEDFVISMTEYEGIRFCSGIRRSNLMAFQFHPEKSGFCGIQIFRNFKEMILKEA